MNVSIARFYSLIGHKRYDAENKTFIVIAAIFWKNKYHLGNRKIAHNIECNYVRGLKSAID